MTPEQRLNKMEAQLRNQPEPPLPLPDALFLEVLTGKHPAYALWPYFQHLRLLPPGTEDGFNRLLNTETRAAELARRQNASKA